MNTQLDTERFLATHGLPQGGFLLEKLAVARLGRDMRVHLRYAPWTDGRAFVLVFHDCESLGWQVYADDEEWSGPDVAADVIGIDLLQGETPQRAVIHTDLFELSLSYRSITVEKDW